MAPLLSQSKKPWLHEPIVQVPPTQLPVALAKVQVWLSPAGTPWPADDPYFTAAPWADVEVLPPPQKWGAADPSGALGFDPAGRPKVTG